MTASLVLFSVASASLLATFAVWRTLRQTRKRLDDLSQSYWQLRYEISELRVQLRGPSASPDAERPPTPARPPGGDAFVPLASLKR